MRALRRLAVFLAAVVLLFVLIQQFQYPSLTSRGPYPALPRPHAVPQVPLPPSFQARHRAAGLGGRPVKRRAVVGQRIRRPASNVTGRASSSSLDDSGNDDDDDAPLLQLFTHDGWPPIRKGKYNKTIQESTYQPSYSIQWDFDTSTFLRRGDVKGKPPKLITMMERPRYYPLIPRPVPLRTCPEMPCRLTTNHGLRSDSAALLWNAPFMRAEQPPKRSNEDQVFVFHNQEVPSHLLIQRSTFWRPAWRSVFNWTMSFRFDSDVLSLYGVLTERKYPVVKDYAAILANKTGKVAWIVSHCPTQSLREKYVSKLQEYIHVDVYGKCGETVCARGNDEKCFMDLSHKYKFFLAFENGICRDYITEKLFRYLEADLVVVARGDRGYKMHAPRGTFINTNDFRSIKELANYLHYLDDNHAEYVKILKAKDRYQPLYEEYPHRDEAGDIFYVHYHYEAIAFCELCRRLWELDEYRKSIPNIVGWFNRGQCVQPHDIH